MNVSGWHNVKFLYNYCIALRDEKVKSVGAFEREMQKGRLLHGSLYLVFSVSHNEQ